MRAIIPFLVVCAGLSLACHAPPGVEKAAEKAAAPPAPDTREPCADHNALRNPYFGDLHVHTSRSFDAFMYDTRATPRDAYRFARGEEIEAAPLDPAGRPSRVAKLQRPLDFAAVTDHAELMGEGALCTDPASPAYASAACQGFRGSAAQPHDERLMLRTRSIVGRWRGQPNPDVCGADGQRCIDQTRSVWQEIREAAETAYDRSAACRFTSFVAYEYSATPDNSNLHRNVIFRSAAVPALPISSIEAPRPLDLWRALHRDCLDAGTGCDVLAIPHNSNKSNGRMFAPEYPGASTDAEQADQARLRAGVETLVEIMQHKGESECRNGLWGVAGGSDELCDFEQLRPPGVEDCREGTGKGGMGDQGCESRHSYVRYALVAGLREAERIGVNPYKLGIIGSTDTHNATPGDVDETTYGGHLGSIDAPLATRIDNDNPGGLAAVWAEENSREALFDAMKRRETFGTSGPRMRVRFFGGWNYARDLCGSPEMLARGYQGGVPMGGDLPARPAGASAPVFMVAAERDPGTAEQPGGLLQRIQIIKGWADAQGRYHQEIHDVAGSAKNGASVDLDTCAPRGPGEDRLCAVWSDPGFDAKQRAVYYARVLENPSCRYNRRLCISLPAKLRPAECGDAKLPKTIQERAWTSPIWYAPAASAASP